MGILDMLKGKRIDDYITEAHELGIKVIDVREPNEYARQHIPESYNVPLSAISSITKVAPDKTQPLYVYCLSGNRSSKACSKLKTMGYDEVTNIGGINTYQGTTVSG